ncbi:uncharacterized protein LOC117315033 isoform X1 [Pecten maximus]|uniref:uncharacterized protein LOC117315033 isoform X1 n=1 Tax=Pecten maximus TaxID=6579 RepID=UPI00145854A2|nr:uncharacterized protein LOC117315033 isoform X1 [Pecten maximus]
MALQIGCMFTFSIISISWPFVAGKGIESVERVEQIRQLLEKLGSLDEEPSMWHASVEEHNIVEAKPSVPNSAWSVNSHGVVDISYNRNTVDNTTQKVLTTQNKFHVARNTTLTSSGMFQGKPLIDVHDSALWLGAGLGALASLSILVLSLLVWRLTRRYYRRKRCIDLTELSLCSMKEKSRPGPVYVRLSQLHNPRKLSKDSHYVVSVLDESNNFSIDSESESSSSEEEIFNASGYKSSDDSFMQCYSGARVNLTSTPIKLSPTSAIRDPPVTPQRPRSNCHRPLPISPLAWSMPYNTPPSAEKLPKYTP